MHDIFVYAGPSIPSIFGHGIYELGQNAPEIQTRGIRTPNETRVLTENINLKFFTQEESQPASPAY